MINWLSKQHRDQRKKEARDKKLREELAKKAQEFIPQQRQVLEDFTDLTINGERQRVSVDRITIIDSTATSITKPADSTKE